jgi:hypothetical protein
MIDTKRAICHSSFEPGNTLMIQRLFTTLLYVDAKTSGKQDQNGRGFERDRTILLWGIESEIDRR